jgi:DNA polymerase III delta prime subunit
MSSIENFVWSEKYRPQTVAECILPQSIKNVIVSMIKNEDVTHILMSGSAGCGKTTLARAIVNDYGGEYLFINASLENGIDTIRTKVMQYSSTVSLEGKQKFLIMDEFDGISRQSQEALRGIIEEFKNVRFFFTCNFKNRIIDAIISRTVEINFTIPSDEKSKLQSQFFKRIVEILKKENVEFDPKAVAELIQKSYPDNRKILNELQRYASGGKIDAGVLIDQSKSHFKDLLKILKEKNFTEMRKWVAKNTDIEPQSLFREIYDSANEQLLPSCIPQVVILAADYGFKSTHSVDQEILIAAFLTEFMAGAQWKQ